MMGYGRGAEYGYNHMAGGGGILGELMVLAFFALATIGIVLLVKWLLNGHGIASSQHTAAHGAPTGALTGTAGHDEAVAITKRRLATGEITPVEYEDIMRVLNP